MTSLSENFTTDELQCPCCHLCVMDPMFVTKLQQFRGICKFPFEIVSGYRCLTHNRAVQGEPNSYHCTGHAADIAYQDGEQLYKLLKFAPLFFNGIGVNNGSIHVDARPIPTAWNYYRLYKKI